MQWRSHNPLAPAVQFTMRALSFLVWKIYSSSNIRDAAKDETLTTCKDAGYNALISRASVNFNAMRSSTFRFWMCVYRISFTHEIFCL